VKRDAPILLAEDDENDTFFLRRALVQSGVRNALIAVQDGQEAVDYLSGKGPYADRAAHPLPGLLLLDLKMPKMGGFEVLAWLSSQPDLKELPVVVLSSSGQDSDIHRARELGADDYQVKPPDFVCLVDIVRNLHSRWLGVESKLT
jgi:CheY-like chemotaxis protein